MVSIYVLSHTVHIAEKNNVIFLYLDGSECTKTDLGKNKN